MRDIISIPGRVEPNEMTTMHIKFIGLLTLAIAASRGLKAQSFSDVAYPQLVSEKYLFQGGVAENGDKLVIDRDDNVYVLTGENLYILLDGKMVPNRQYRPLQGKTPIDISVQSESGELYYLYPDHYLSNTHAGKPFGQFEPGIFTMIAVNSAGHILVAGGQSFQIFREGHSTTGRESTPIQEIKACGNDFFIKTKFGISLYEDGRFESVVNDSKITSWAIVEDSLFIGSESGYYIVNPTNGRKLKPTNSGLPVIPPTSMTVLEGSLWMGSGKGAYATRDHDDFRYFASRRWLLEDLVLDVGVDSNGNGYILTQSGVSKIKFEPMTLETKADYFHQKIRKRHLRYGLIGEVHLQKPGDISTMEMVDTDNDGLWTSFYLGSEVFRYATTGDQQARANAMESFEAFERLLSINQLEGFPSRTFEREGYKVSDLDRWRDSPEDGWEWKGHTSSDEFVAYIWVAGILSQYLDLNAEEEARVREFIDQIMSHIIRHDYYFVDVDGKPTLWGRWNPEYINHYPESVTDRKLGSATITAGLHLAYKLTGKELYKEEWNRLFDQFGYLDNIRIPISSIRSTPNVFYAGHNMGEGGWNHSDDEMYFLTYWILYHFAPEDLKSTYSSVISDHWKIEQPERNALWNLISYGTSGDLDLESVRWHLHEFPLDMVRWRMENSHRKDLEFLESNFRDQTTSRLISPAERAAVRHNANPFRLDSGGDGREELAGDEYLLPYWMGRFLKVIVPSE